MPRTKPSEVGKLVVRDGPLGGNPVDAAAYAASIVGELAKLMRWYRLSTLAYFLEMAQLAAEESLHEAHGTAPIHSHSRGDSVA